MQPFPRPPGHITREGRGAVYTSNTETMIIAGLGALFLLWGLVLLILGHYDTATTALLASLSCLGIYLGYEQLQRKREE